MKPKRLFKIMLLSVAIIVIAFIAGVFLFMNVHPVFGGKPSGVEVLQYEARSNYQAGKFTNLGPVKEDFSWDDYKKMIAKWRKGNPNKQPPSAPPVVKWTDEEVKSIHDSSVTAVWYGHSAFYLKMNGLNILLDPMFGKSPSPLPAFSAGRFNDTLPIEIRQLPEIDLIVFSHDHYDHLDYPSVLALKEKTKRFLVPLGLAAHLRKWGVEEHKITELYWHEAITIGGIDFTCTPAQHFSGRGFSDRMKTLWASWVIKGDKSIFFSGDSGYFPGFKEIGDKYGPFDACFMECGQYDVLWSEIHMMPEETAQAHEDLRGDLLIPIHWGAFTLALHDWDDSPRRVKAAAEAKGINLAFPTIGQPIKIGEPQEFGEWWAEVR